MNKTYIKVLIFTFFLILGAISGAVANDDDPVESPQECTWCYYGSGCEDTTLSNTCSPEGKTCSNQAGCA